MNRKLIYARLALVILLPFVYGFVEGYSFWAPFVNLVTFATGEEYDAGLLLLVLLALLLLVVFVVTLTSSPALRNPKKHVILHPSDGQQLARENQQKVLQLQALLQNVEKEQLRKPKRSLADSELDMNNL